MPLYIYLYIYIYTPMYIYLYIYTRPFYHIYMVTMFTWLKVFLIHLLPPQGACDSPLKERFLLHSNVFNQMFVFSGGNQGIYWNARERENVQVSGVFNIVHWSSDTLYQKAKFSFLHVKLSLSGKLTFKGTIWLCVFCDFTYLNKRKLNKCLME